LGSVRVCVIARSSAETTPAAEEKISSVRGEASTLALAVKGSLLIVVSGTRAKK